LTSGYYASIDRPPNKRAQRHERIRQSVRTEHAESHEVYGSVKIARHPSVNAASRSAEQARRPQANQLLHHSDRGCQYTSDDYQQTLRTLGIECSMSGAESCYDNAAMERFFWSLKHEWTSHESFDDEAATRLSVFKYIETFYNSVRLHQTLGYQSPNQFKAVHTPASAA
jgi:putative transposase